MSISDRHVALIPVNKCQETFRETLMSVQCPSVTTSSPSEELAVSLISGKWLLHLHWVVKKKWIKKHKIPITPQYAKKYEPKGTYLFRLLKLCIELHWISHWGKANYNDAGHWFASLVEVERGSEIDYVINSNVTNIHISKNDMKEVHRSILKSLSESEPKNPFDFEVMPHHYRLMQAAIEAQNLDIFVDQYWTPFLKAYRAWVRSLDDPYWGAMFIENDKVKVRAGKRKGIRVLT